MRGFSPGRLNQLRVDRNFSLSDLARLANIGRSTLHHWETGHATPQVDLLARAADTLGVSIGDLVHIPEHERFPGDLRILRGLTQPQLGREAEVPTATVGAIERGEVALTEEYAQRLAAALDVPIEMYRAAYERSRRRPPGTPA
uniref:helix-turn-helix transcriptional regulator n=1 Tax=Gordonia westfalica TaxID=158898 RepID=UPI000023177F|nr:helix-turn-helix transcriptional regulator [Gordonia westfalica]CAE09164.1 putative repressor protein [Gordonia westfalica]